MRMYGNTARLATALLVIAGAMPGLAQDSSLTSTDTISVASEIPSTVPSDTGVMRIQTTAVDSATPSTTEGIMSIPGGEMPGNTTASATGTGSGKPSGTASGSGSENGTAEPTMGAPEETPGAAAGLDPVGGVSVLGLVGGLIWLLV